MGHNVNPCFKQIDRGASLVCSIKKPQGFLNLFGKSYRYIRVDNDIAETAAGPIFAPVGMASKAIDLNPGFFVPA